MFFRWQMLGHSCRGALNSAPRLRHFCQSKIQNLRVTASGEEDVGRLDVTMDDATLMCGVQCVRHLDRKREHQFDLYRLSADAMLQGHTFEEFHGNESL